MASATSKNSSNNGKRKKVLLLTGACNGIGKAIVKEFYKSDYNIMINDIKYDELKNMAENILPKVFPQKSNDNKIAYFFGDISQQEISRSLIEKTVKNFGSIDVLINNTSMPGTPVIGKTTSNYIEPNTTDYFTLEEYGISDRNLKGAYLCIRELVQYVIINNNNKDKNQMINDKKNISETKITKTFSIINISCPYGSIPDDIVNKGTISQSGIDPFTSSRSGIKTLTKTVALQLAHKGIRVNAIAPGIISTDIYQDAKEEGNQKDISKVIPFNRIGTPEEIAHVALFLSAGGSSSYVTGTIIYVDGGLNLLHPNFFLESHLNKD